MYGVVCLIGIGFMMSLFIGNLVFIFDEMLNVVKFGVFVGLIVLGFVGYVVLCFVFEG